MGANDFAEESQSETDVCEYFSLRGGRMTGKCEPSEGAYSMAQGGILIYKGLDDAAVRDLCSSDCVVVELTAKRMLEVVISKDVLTERKVGD